MKKFTEMGRRAALFRKSLGLTQHELAEKANINRAYITHIETGKTNPSFDFLYKMQKTFNMSIDWLVTGNGQRIVIDEKHLFNQITEKHIELINELLKKDNMIQEKIINGILEILRADSSPL